MWNEQERPAAGGILSIPLLTDVLSTSLGGLLSGAPVPGILRPPPPAAAPAPPAAPAAAAPAAPPAFPAPPAAPAPPA
jgi:hypothetical protein